MSSADFTIAEFLAWVRTKPADEQYDYIDNSNCALCQFLRETDRCATPFVVPLAWGDSDETQPNEFSRELETCLKPGYGPGESLWRGTFAALVERLERLCPETPVNASNWQAIDAYLTDIEDVSRERVLS